MTGPAANEIPQDEPLDPAAERVRRKLVRFMAINLGILFLALMAVVGALVYRSLSTPEPEAVAIPSELPMPPAGSLITGEIALPAGTRVVSHAISGSRLTLETENGTARAIYVYDIAAARLIARYDLVEAR